MRRTCLHGGAHGAWKDITARVVGGKKERWLWNAASEVISVICDMIDSKRLSLILLLRNSRSAGRT